jgi:probable addiction module antidote protein
MKASVRFEMVLKDHLADQEQAAKYLTACYEEGPEVFLQALRDVVDAQGGMSRTARLAGLNRESLYRQLSRLEHTVPCEGGCGNVSSGAHAKGAKLAKGETVHPLRTSRALREKASVVLTSLKRPWDIAEATLEPRGFAGMASEAGSESSSPIRACLRLTQEFFGRFLTREYLRQLRPHQGKFRSFLAFPPNRKSRYETRCRFPPPFSSVTFDLVRLTRCASCAFIGAYDLPWPSHR